MMHPIIGPVLRLRRGLTGPNGLAALTGRLANQVTVPPGPPESQPVSKV
jgi:hypothetical protein